MTADEESSMNDVDVKRSLLSNDSSVLDINEKTNGGLAVRSSGNGGIDGDIDIEKQHTDLKSSNEPVEYRFSTSTKMVFLLAYFVLNLGLTLSNKAILQRVKFPWLLTAMHSFATSMGCAAVYGTGQFRLSKLSMKENLILLAFSSLFTLNIAISNVSLSLVSVPFHQVLRATCPIATILVYRVVFGREYGQQTYLTMIPLVVGASIATYGDYYFTLSGLLLTLLGVVLAAIKTVTTNKLMTGSLNLSPLETLFRMSPLAAGQCLVYASASGEIFALKDAIETFTPSLMIMLAVNASIAFALNMVSFQTNKVAGALTISVCGNIKQCMTILLGILLFSVKVTPMNGLGMAITTAGAAWYSKVELDMKRPR